MQLITTRSRETGALPTSRRPHHRADPRSKLFGGIVRTLALVADWEAVERLVRLFSGQRVYVPHKMAPDCRLWEIGRDAARQLERLHGGDYINVPMLHTFEFTLKKQQIADYLAAHSEPYEVSKRELARKFDVHPRTVQRIRAELAALKKDGWRVAGAASSSPQYQSSAGRVKQLTHAPVQLGR